MSRQRWSEALRRTLLCGLSLASTVPVTGCTLALNRKHDQCATNQDCQSLAVGAVCTTNGLCERVDAPKPNPDACQRDADCVDPWWAVCRNAVCLSLVPQSPPNEQNCLALGSDDPSDDRQRLAIGVLVTGFELADTTVSAFTGAIQELNDARDPRLPRLLGVACDETKTAELFELVNSSKIGVLIGPTQAASLEQVSATVNGKAVLFAPFADLPTLNSLTQTSALVSCKPQRSDLESSLSSAIGFVQSQLQDKGLVPAASRTVLDATLDEAPYLDASSAGGLATDGIGNVTMYNSHLTGKALAKALEGGSPAPALLVSLSGEVDWTANIEAVDAERAPGPFPYFLLSDTKSTALAVSNGDFQSMPDQYARVLALGYRRSAASQLVYEGVAAEFESQMARPFGPGQDYVYDCTYLAVYSALAAELRFALSPSELTPGAIISGLGALKGGKMSLSVGNISDVCAALEKGSGALSSTDLIGSSGDLDMVGPPWTDDWTVTTERAIYTHPSATDAALYCIQASEFCDTGVTFPTSGGAATKAKSTCTCLLSQ